ncbi:MAG: PolC-type DNA polymerase III [Tissierellia bacterium]|nr:PolC-type DNA polymerase III [Tissierellia bacterium]
MSQPKMPSLYKLFKRNNIEVESYMNSIYIEEVRLFTRDNRLKITMISKDLVSENLILNIKDFFQNKFKGINIDINMKYDIPNNIEKDLDRYWNNILQYVENIIPSSKSWINSLECSVNKDTIILYPENKGTKYAIEVNKLANIIKEKIKSEFNIDIQIKIDDSKIIDNGVEFMEKREDEEKKICSDILNKNGNNLKKDDKNSNNLYENYIFGKKIAEEPIKIGDINSDTNSAVLVGQIFDLEIKDIKGNRKIATFNITDLTDSITCKIFLNDKQFDDFALNIKEGVYIKIKGDLVYDNFLKCQVVMVKDLNICQKEERMDTSKEKRVELHLHTQMSAMDGVSNFKEIAKRAKKWGHRAIAITDHGVVQGFPEAMDIAKDLGLKVIYGVEGYLVNDKKPILSNYEEDKKYNKFVVFDIETTGLSPKNDMITEIGAIKIEDNKIVDEFNQLINPGRKIPDNIVKLTGITDEMVKDKPTIEEVLPKFEKFMEDAVLVAHNASFDVGFIKYKFSKLGKEIDNPVLDTLELSRALFPQLKSHKLDIIAKHLNVDLVNHHRAVDDAKATAEILLKSLDILSSRGINNINRINDLIRDKSDTKGETFHVVILAKNIIGLKNLYRLISESHINYFYRRPRIPKSLLNKYREGLIIGSACEAGELYRAILRNKDAGEIKEIVKFYDYLEIQPLENNMHLIRNGLVKGKEDLIEINKKIVELGKQFGKIVVATGDVHFLDPEDEIYRKILMAGQGYSDAEYQPPLYFKTTDEMLKEFEYLGEEIAYEVVVRNTNIICDMIEDIQPIPDGTYPPEIDGADEELRKMTYERAIEIYGDPLPKIVKERLDKELNSIIKNGYAVMYIIAQKLVSKSLEDGYLVGSRGSVGSSFAATMSGITEVNPLPPHYVCPNCKFSEFIEDGSVGSGVDMPDKDCPNCNTKLVKDGHDIPFEVFLGFEGDKEPDIDLNFAGEYQARAHKYTEELFGEGYVFRAGTIGTIAEKTAYGFVKKYFEQKGISPHPAEINRLVRGCTGIKRTSGQHPGGVMIVPKHKDIHDFTPIQYPADDKSSGVITTHFDYHAISSSILKLDVLGHDVPTIIRMLEDITGVDPRKIPLDDKATMKLFTSTEPLDLKEEIGTEIGTLGIPEFGTKFVRQMLIDTKPTTFAELVRISGLSHGTDVWINNAQDLVRNGIAPLSKVISTRDDIMLYLIYQGLDKKRAFKIMERVRKGKGLSDEDKEYMRSFNVPEWYIESCEKIKYMFPKAHAVAYVMMSFRIAYFKVHYPEAFYATYFTTKAQDFDAGLILKGKDVVNNKIYELEKLGNNMTAKEKNLLTVLEVVQEMYARGFTFDTLDLYKSDSDKFIIGDNGIIPPLKTLEGVGETAARKIVEERNKGKFISIEDFIRRTRASKTVVEALREQGCLKDLPESNQISLFNI